MLFDGENISFDASLVVCVCVCGGGGGTNIPPLMILNMIYENHSSVAVACFLLGRAKDLSSTPVVFNQTNCTVSNK
jgi:hypothetical protein